MARQNLGKVVPIKGVDYFDGYTPIKGVDYFDGTNGKDGYTPQRGIDYWTNEDKQEIIQNVLDELPNTEEVEY